MEEREFDEMMKIHSLVPVLSKKNLKNWVKFLPYLKAIHRICKLPLKLHDRENFSITIRHIIDTRWLVKMSIKKHFSSLNVNANNRGVDDIMFIVKE